MSDQRTEQMETSPTKPKATIEDVLVGVHLDEQDQLLRWFARMSQTERLDVMTLQSHLMRSWRSKNKGTKIQAQELALGCLLLALVKRQQTQSVLSRKAPESEEDQIRLKKMRIDAIKENTKSEGKKARIYRIRYHELAKDLRDNGLGWRRCASYLGKFHKFKISNTHLKELYEKREAAIRTGEGEDE